MSVPTDIVQYQTDKSLLMALRSLHWFIVTLKNRGIPREITDLFERGEINLTLVLSKLDDFNRINRIVEAEIDTFYVSEPQPTNRHRHEIWAEAKQRCETFDTIRTSLALYTASIRRLAGLSFDAAPLAQGSRKLGDVLGVFILKKFCKLSILNGCYFKQD